MALETHSQKKINANGLRNGLKISYLLMVGIGILALVFGGSMTFWLRDLSLEFIDTRAPRVQLFERLETGLESTTSALTDYVSELEENDKAKYKNVWKNEINPSIVQLLLLEKGNPSQLRSVKKIHRQLKDLALWQWHIEDVASMAGNNPTRYFLDSRLNPIIDQALFTIDIMLQMEFEAINSYSSRKIQLNKMKYSLMSMKFHVSEAIHETDTNRFSKFVNDIIKINIIRQDIIRSDAVISNELLEQQNQLFSLLDSIFIFSDEIQTIANKYTSNVAVEWLFSQNRTRVDAVSMAIELLLKKERSLLKDSGNKVRWVGRITPYILITLLVFLFTTGFYFIRKGVKNFIEPVIDLEKQDSLKADIADLSKSLLGITDIQNLSNITATYFAKKLNASAVAIFVEKSSTLYLSGGYAIPQRLLNADEGIKANQGLIGQAYSENKTITITGGLDDELSIESSLVQLKPKLLIISPIVFQGEVVAVIEMVSLKDFTDYDKAFITSALSEVGILINAAKQGERVREALSQAQSQSEELQANQEELNATNETLEKQKEALYVTNEELKTKSKAIQDKSMELEKANYELSVKSNNLEYQAAVLKQAESEAAEKARQLEEASRYKSEFLANMSHELRTPLNSLLILAKILAENEEKNLDAEQVESASVIFDSGTHLLNLINDILDLSKIEAGRMDIALEEVMIPVLASSMSTRFKHMAEAKGLGFFIKGVEDSVESIVTDGIKLQQILTNLIGNSIKFTPSGSVTLDIAVAEHEKVIAFSIIDTGVGIEEDKQAAIFEAFQQEDGSTSRNFGGTGLGLSISLAYSKLLGGDIQLQSEKGVGSTFTLYLPIEANNDTALDDVVKFDQVLAEKSTSETSSLDNTSIKRINTNSVDSENSDDELSDNKQSGTKIKEASDTGHTEENSNTTLLLIEDDNVLRHVLKQRLTNEKQTVMDASSAAEATALISSEQFDCIILDLGLSDKNGYEWLEEINNTSLVLPPVIIYSGYDLTQDDEIKLRKYTDTIIIKSSHSSERLLEEISIRLNKSRNSDDSELIVNTAAKTDAASESTIYHDKAADGAGHDTTSTDNNIIKLKDKRVLVVDDDMRNTFALSKALRNKGMLVEMASGGKQALEKLIAVEDFDMVLMDIMMPGMDGYQTTEEIRKLPQFSELPIIAVTAKAMKGDKEKCLAAGANDYLSKPIDLDKLQSSMLNFVQ